MFDEIPTRAWFLVAIAAFAFVPLQYVYRHIAHSPRGRDITLPPEDLSWRTSGRLIRHLAVLAGLAALAVFIFTPQAEQFARSSSFVPSILAALGALTLVTVIEGFSKGRIRPFVRGSSDFYERETQPRRFWASAAWNTVVGVACLVLSFAPTGQDFTTAAREKSRTVLRAESRCYGGTADYEAQAALAACNELLAGNDAPKTARADILAARGYAYHRLGDYQKARADYSQALALDPKNFASLYNRSLVNAELNDGKRAAADYQALLRVRPGNADEYIDRGLVLLDAGEFEKAAADFTDAHKLRPNDQWPLANRGLAYAWLKDRARAETDFATVRKIDPSNVVLLHGEALLAMNAGEWNTAVARLTEALRADPKDAWSLRKRADAYWAMGERDKARDDDDRLWQLGKGAQQVQVRNDGASRL